MRYKSSFDGLTDEVRKKAAACKTPEELLELAKSEGFKLSDDQLEGISGGRSTCSDNDWSTCSTYNPNECSDFGKCNGETCFYYDD